MTMTPTVARVSPDRMTPLVIDAAGAKEFELCCSDLVRQSDIPLKLTLQYPAFRDWPRIDVTLLGREKCLYGLRHFNIKRAE